MTTVPLTKGYSAMIDDEDAERVLSLKWYASVRRRADGSLLIYGCRDNAGKVIYLHRFIAGDDDPTFVDHRDGNGLNCQRGNLRRATHKQNLRNMRLRKYAKSSQFKGVHWFKRDSRWRACIMVDGKGKHIGYFDSEIDAAKAYDLMARQKFGEFASTNFTYAL